MISMIINSKANAERKIKVPTIAIGGEKSAKERKEKEKKKQTKKQMQQRLMQKRDMMKRHENENENTKM